MEDARQWIERYKEQLIFAGVVIMVLAPFLWPFFLMIIFQVLIVVIPILIIRLIIQKEKTNGQKRNQEEPDTGSAGFYTEKAVSDRSASDGKKDAKTDPVPERNKETKAEPIGRNGKGRQEINEDSCTALMWYKLEGRERIVRIIKNWRRKGEIVFLYNVPYKVDTASERDCLKC